MEYVLLEEVLAFHAEIKGVPVGTARDHVHRLDRLESALDRPRNAAAYENADLVRQAATLMWGLVRGHPFVDGNKRTALVVTRVFLELNGHTLDLSEDEKFALVIGTANGGVTVDQIAAAFRTHIKPRQGQAFEEGAASYRVRRRKTERQRPRPAKTRAR